MVAGIHCPRTTKKEKEDYKLQLLEQIKQTSGQLWSDFTSVRQSHASPSLANQLLAVALFNKGLNLQTYLLAKKVKIKKMLNNPFNYC